MKYGARCVISFTMRTCMVLTGKLFIPKQPNNNSYAYQTVNLGTIDPKKRAISLLNITSQLNQTNKNINVDIVTIPRQYVLKNTTDTNKNNSTIALKIRYGTKSKIGDIGLTLNPYIT